MHDEAPSEWKKIFLLAATCALFGLTAVGCEQFGGAPPWVATLLYALSCVAGGWDAAGDAWATLKERRIDVHTLMLIVALGAWVVGHGSEGALLLFLFCTASAIERFTMERTRGAIDALLDQAPKKARLLGLNAQESEVLVVELQPGQLVIILPGELIPADGEVHEGESGVDESNLTGEAKPVAKRPGSAVASGSLNGWGRLVILVTKAEKDSALHRIVALIREAQESKAPAQRTIDRWGDSYAIFTLVAATVFFCIQLLLGKNALGSEDSALYRSMTLLVVLSPCALILSVPSAVLAAIAAGARHGILFRGGAAVERLADVDCICFDKTGTLTAGEPAVAALEVFPTSADRLRALSALLTLEANSTHPFARGIVKACQAEGAATQPVVGLSNAPGQGIAGSIDGTRWSVGSREFVGGQELPAAPVAAGAIVSEVWASDGSVVVRATLVDQIRPASGPTLAALHAQGIRTIMLTGDREEAAVVAAQQVGIQTYRAGLTPDAKMQAIRKLSAEGHVVAMVGDGVNDAPSLAAADVAIGMGGRGSDAALESSDIVLTDDRIGRLLTAIDLSKAARTAIRVNIALSVGAALTMATIVISNGAPLTMGVAVHEGSTVIVCLNGLRLLAHRPRRGL